MLELTISAKNAFSNKQNKFLKTKETTIRLEHSLVSLSKWESKYQKPFISQEQKTREEILDYIKFMTITQNVDPLVIELLNETELKAINDYISAPMTATKFYENKGPEGQGSPIRKKEVITSELIYYWMISFQIPFEFEKWHLNRLLTLIRVCSIKEKQSNGKGSKMSKRDILAQNKAINAARKQKYNTHG